MSRIVIALGGNALQSRDGPQVGRSVLASEAAKDVTPAMPFDVCGAMSQGYIGYHIQQALKYALSIRNINVPVTDRGDTNHRG